MILTKKTEKQSSDGSILIVEDNPSDREFLSRALAEKNYKPIVIESSRVVEVAKEIKPVLIVIGSVLTGAGKKGLILCGRLKATVETKKIPVLVLAEKDDQLNVIEYYSQGVNGYLKKPVTKKELVAQVETLLNRQ